MNGGCLDAHTAAGAVLCWDCEDDLNEEDERQALERYRPYCKEAAWSCRVTALPARALPTAGRVDSDGELGAPGSDHTLYLFERDTNGKRGLRRKVCAVPFGGSDNAMSMD